MQAARSLDCRECTMQAGRIHLGYHSGGAQISSGGRALVSRKKRCTPVTAYAIPAPLQYDIPVEPPIQLLVPQAIPSWADKVEGGICAPKGFRAQGMYAGLRQSSHRADLALLASSQEAVVAACSLAVQSNRVRCGTHPTARAVLITAGRDEAVTAGAMACHTVAGSVAGALSIPSDQVLLISIGGTGAAQKEAVISAIPGLAASLDGGIEGAYHAACALTTTDTTCKSAAMEVSLGPRRSVRLGGIAHGDVRGLQALITCDAPVSAELWQDMFGRAMQGSFKQLALASSGGPAPADSVLALANGAAGGGVIRESSEEAGRLEQALTALMQGLAKEVAWDGEGARCLLEVEVVGAPNSEAAKAVALSVAGSAAVRAAVRACTPDWTAIADAASRAGVEVQRDSLRVSVGGMPLIHHGHLSELASSAAAYCQEYLHDHIARHGEVKIEVEIGEGAGVGKAWGSSQSTHNGKGQAGAMHNVVN